MIVSRLLRAAPGIAFIAAVLILLEHLVQSGVLRRALLTSLVVGTALTAINQGDALIAATLTPVLLWKIPLTYAVPFGVSTYSALAISRDRSDTQSKP